MKNVSFCIVGTNFISDAFVNASRAVDGVDVAAVFSRKSDTGAAFGEKHGINRVFTDYSDVISSPDVTAIYVASPIFMHKEHTVRALLAGKHVLCEKSIALSYDEYTEMRRAEEMSGCVLLEAMRPAFDPAFFALKAALPKIGRIRRADFNFCKYSSRYDDFKAGIHTNAFDSSIGNSALLDIGVYPLWFVLALFGEPIGFSASGVRIEGGFLASGTALLDYGDMLAEVSYSKIHDSFSPSVIEGEEGALFIDKVNDPSRVVFKSRDGFEEVVYDAPCENNMVYEIAAFRDMINGKADFLPHLDLSGSLMRLMDGIGSK